jgi:hypothetical protein
MPEMTVANLKGPAARLASGGLARDTHAPIERTVGNHRSVMFEIEKFAIGDLHYRLTDNVVVGPVTPNPELVTIIQKRFESGAGAFIQYTEF